MSLSSRSSFHLLCTLALLGALGLPRTGLAASAELPACDHTTQPRWYRATSAHFRIRTSLDEDSARRAARELERLRDALRSMWGPAFDPPGRLDVLLVRDAELAGFTAQSVSVGGFHVEDANDVPLMVLAVRGERFDERADRATLAHEMAHYLTRFLFRRDSRWVSEGLASFLETVRLAEGPAGTVLGFPREGHLKYLRAHGCLPLEELWRWDERPKLEDPGLHDLYASSWLWMHYLFGRHHERLTRFEKGLYDAKEPHQAWKEAFGDLTEQELEKGLQEYVRGNVYQATSFAAPPEPPPARVEALPSADIHAVWALLWLHAPGERPWEERLSRARPEVQRALSEDASNVAAVVLRSGMARDEAERLALARALVKARPDAGEAWSLLGRALQTAEAPLAEQEEAFLRAVALQPDSASTQGNLARHYLLRDLPEKALEPATRAWQMAPASAFSLEPYAVAALRLGYCGDGLRTLRQALSVAGARTSTQPEVLRALGDRLARYERACAEAARTPPAR